MEHYETIVIASPLVGEEDVNEVVSGLEQVISDGGGTLKEVDRWGKRKLSYRIKKFEEGIYTLFSYGASGDTVRELERRIRIDDRLIRFMTVKVDWTEKVARAEAQKAARRRKAPAAPNVEPSPRTETPPAPVTDEPAGDSAGVVSEAKGSEK